MEKTYRVKGTCCDNGRFIFRNCGNWWYNCESYGLSDIKTWVKIGDYGFPFPLATAHKGQCLYSPERIKCNVDKDCLTPIPETTSEICKEIPNIVKRPVGWNG